jgi:hypothetical protein
MDADIQRDARKAINAIKKSNYKASVIRRETEKISKGNASRIRQVVAEQVRDAATYADRAAEVVKAWKIETRLTGEDVPDQATESDVRKARKGAAYDAEAMLARESFAPLKTPSQVSRALKLYGVTGISKQPPLPSNVTKSLQRIKPPGAVGLSQRLHGADAANDRAIRKGVSRVIREGKSLAAAGKELVRTVKGLGAQQKLPKVLQRLKKAGRKLALEGAGSDPDAIRTARKEWNKAYNAVKRHANRLVDKRGGYTELVQRLKKGKAELTDNALNQWMNQKQRWNAERIVETESSAAYRLREYDQVKSEGVVTHFYWRLNRGSSFARKRRRKRFGAPVTGRRGRARKRSNKAMRSCVCTELADKKFPIDMAKDYPRGGHPWCRCWFEYVGSTGKMNQAPVTQADIDWYNNLPD